MADMNISNKLKKARKDAGLTQKEIYDWLGINQSTFSSWETGKSEPSVFTFLQLCAKYQIEDICEYFLYDKAAPKRVLDNKMLLKLSSLPPRSLAAVFACNCSRANAMFLVTGLTDIYRRADARFLTASLAHNNRHTDARFLAASFAHCNRHTNARLLFTGLAHCNRHADARFLFTGLAYSNRYADTRFLFTGLAHIYRHANARFLAASLAHIHKYTDTRFLTTVFAHYGSCCANTGLLPTVFTHYGRCYANAGLLIAVHTQCIAGICPYKANHFTGEQATHHGNR